MQNGSVYMKQSIQNPISHNLVKLARKNTHMTQSNDPAATASWQAMRLLVSIYCWLVTQQALVATAYDTVACYFHSA